MKDENVTFQGCPGEKDGDRSIGSEVEQPPHQTDRRHHVERIQLAAHSTGVDVEWIVEDLDAECEHEQNDDHVIVHGLPKPSIEEKVVEKEERARE